MRVKIIDFIIKKLQIKEDFDIQHIFNQSEDFPSPVDLIDIV